MFAFEIEKLSKLLHIDLSIVANLSLALQASKEKIESRLTNNNSNHHQNSIALLLADKKFHSLNAQQQNLLANVSNTLFQVNNNAITTTVMIIMYII